MAVVLVGGLAPHPALETMVTALPSSVVEKYISLNLIENHKKNLRR